MHKTLSLKLHPKWESNNQLALNQNLSSYLMTTNSSLSFQVSQYKNSIKETKALLSIANHKAATIESLLKSYNVQLRIINSKLQVDYSLLLSRYNQSKSDLNSNVAFLSSKLDKAKEDNFILANALFERNTMIKHLNTDLNMIREDCYSGVRKSELYTHYTEKAIATCQNLQLSYYQSKLFLQSRRHNKETLKSTRLMTEVYEMKRKMNENKACEGVGSKLIEDGSFTFRFEPFEEEAIETAQPLLDELEDSKDKAINNENDNDNRLLTTERDTNNNSNTKRVIPKLDLKQIEFNKPIIAYVKPRHQSSNEQESYCNEDNHSNDSCSQGSPSSQSSASQEDRDEIQIAQMEQNIQQLRQKLLSNYDLICDFKRFCYQFKSHHARIEWDLTSNNS